MVLEGKLVWEKKEEVMWRHAAFWHGFAAAGGLNLLIFFYSQWFGGGVRGTGLGQALWWWHVWLSGLLLQQGQDISDVMLGSDISGILLPMCPWISC